VASVASSASAKLRCTSCARRRSQFGRLDKHATARLHTPLTPSESQSAGERQFPAPPEPVVEAFRSPILQKSAPDDSPAGMWPGPASCREAAAVLPVIAVDVRESLGVASGLASDSPELMKAAWNPPEPRPQPAGRPDQRRPGLIDLGGGRRPSLLLGAET